ncbi:MAG: hypothetical protein Q9191_000917 [Dirinaria sp. TL-2023a]
MSNIDQQLRHQWADPGDILSLLLLIGGDIVQKAIAQLVGCEVRVPGSSTRLSITPVAFSFGWVAYSFSNILTAFGEMRLMPSTDCPSLLVNCSNGFVRENRSWILGRLLRDHELKCAIDSRGKDQGGKGESIRIDIFSLGPVSFPDRDFVWWLGWVVIAIQIMVSILPWILHGVRDIMTITICGNLLAVLTGAMPQWAQEKWPTAKLDRDKITCLTRGNGYQHIMVFIGSSGSWNLEILATGGSHPRPETRWMLLILAGLWTCLLVSVAGIKSNTWFLMGIGGIGMLQNLLAAAKPRSPATANVHTTRYSRAAIIIGLRDSRNNSPGAEEDPVKAEESLAAVVAWISRPKQAAASTAHPPSMPQWLASMSKEDGTPVWLQPIKPERGAQVTYSAGVHGALIELEKWIPTAGLAMVQVFFPHGLVYNDPAIRDNVHKRFWKKAYSTRSVRKEAERQRRSEEQKRGTSLHRGAFAA